MEEEEAVRQRLETLYRFLVDRERTPQHWSARIRGELDRGSLQIHRVRSMFGGMGALDDLRLSSQGRDRIDPSREAEENDELRRLRGALSTALLEWSLVGRVAGSAESVAQSGSPALMRGEKLRGP